MAGRVAYYGNIVRDGLVLNLDAAKRDSYPGSGTSWTNLTTNTNSIISGTYDINTTTYKTPVLSLNNTGSASNGQVQLVTQDLNALAQTQNFTVIFAARKNFYGVGGNNYGNSQIFVGATNGYSTGWRITESSQGTPGAPFSGNYYTNNQIFTLGYNDINTSLQVSSPVNTGNQICICAFSVSTSTILGFVNGQTNSRSNPLTYASGTNLSVISSTQGGAGSWNGFVGFFMIYNRALSLSEITQNYNALKGRYGL
jgi:hypothetical protein